MYIAHAHVTSKNCIVSDNVCERCEIFVTRLCSSFSTNDESANLCMAKTSMPTFPHPLSSTSQRHTLFITYGRPNMQSTKISIHTIRIAADSAYPYASPYVHVCSQAVATALAAGTAQPQLPPFSKLLTSTHSTQAHAATQQQQQHQI